MDGVKLSASEIVIPESEIQGVPRIMELGQWIPHEDRPWWTEESLREKRGLQPGLTTGRFLERGASGWRFKVFSDIERSALFLSRDGRSRREA